MDFLDKLLNFYKISRDEYEASLREVEVKDLPTLTNFYNGEKSLEVLKNHMENNDKIVIYGDYDCDGMVATSILKIAFNKVNYSNVGYYIPNRYNDGYGITLEYVKKFINLNYKLIICVDNGVTCTEALNYALENGIDVIICDHHQITKELLPNTPYIIHPEYSNMKSICSGGYTSYVLAQALLPEFDEYMFSLAGISIITDLMNLTDENKLIVKYAIKLLRNNPYKQIKILAENNVIDENIIGNLIGPKVNSLGRILDDNKINIIVKFFSSTDVNEINKIFYYIEEINNQRKKIALEYNYNLEKHINEPCIVEVIDIKEGLVGLISNKYLELAKKPTLIFTKTNDGILKGSVRSRPGISVIEFFDSCKDIILSSGGHSSAGGISIYEKDYDLLTEKFKEFCSNKSFIEERNNILEISLNEVTLENLNILENFGPFGKGNEAPEFLIKHLLTNKFNISRDNKHIVTKLSPNSSILYFNFDSKILSNKYVNLYGSFRANYYRSYKSLNFVVKNFDMVETNG